MRHIFDIPVETTIPSMEAVLRNQGVPSGTRINERTASLAREALSAFEVLAKPRGVVMRISPEKFEPIYQGLGQNADHTPLLDIHPRANAIALFAVTLGDTICEEISRLFSSDEYATGAMLDATASVGTEIAADQAEQCFRRHLSKSGDLATSDGVMQFSPGYCGWHISAQAGLFETLHPQEIGISLNESFLMTPLKSISGAIIAGDKKIFEFDDNFDFCDECKNHSCIDRAKALREK